jgi:hypothetical protein
MGADSQVLCIPGWGAKAGWKSDTVRTLQTILTSLLQPGCSVDSLRWDRDGSFPSAQSAADTAGREDLGQWICKREEAKEAYHLIAYPGCGSCLGTATRHDSRTLSRHLFSRSGPSM